MIKPFDPSKFEPKRSLWRNGITLSLVGVVALLALVKLMMTFKDKSGGDLNVYCSSSLQGPVLEAIAEFEKEYSVDVKFEFYSSAALEVKLEQDRAAGKGWADLYIADDAFFSNRTQEKDLTRESVPLASFRLVFATKASHRLKVGSVDDIIDQKIAFAICDPAKGLGLTTKNALLPTGKWQNVLATKKATFSTANELVEAVQSSSELEGCFIWSSTAKKHGLNIHELPELADVRTTITSNLVSTTTKPTMALLLARYLADKDKGGKTFSAHHFSPVPEIKLFCSEMSKDAISPTIEEFRKRENCNLQVEYGKAETLVSRIKAIHEKEGADSVPDIFLSGHALNMREVNAFFGETRELAGTSVVMLVRKGNPQGISSLDDLDKKDLKVGLANKKMSSLGHLSWSLLEGWGISQEDKRAPWSSDAKTSDELIEGLRKNPETSVVMVYEANCRNLSKEEFEIIFIDDPSAENNQYLRISTANDEPRLSMRLIDAVTSQESKTRFEDAGFIWQAEIEPIE